MFAWKGKKWKCLRSTSTCATLTKRWAEICKPLVHNDRQIFVKEDIEILWSWNESGPSGEVGEEQKAVASSVHLCRPTQQRQVLLKSHDLYVRSKVSLVSRVKVSLVTQWQFSSTGVNGQAWFEKCGRKQKKSRGIILSNRYLAFSPWLLTY